jgi:hypothetical protein
MNYRPWLRHRRFPALLLPKLLHATAVSCASGGCTPGKGFTTHLDTAQVGNLQTPIPAAAMA